MLSQLRMFQIFCASAAILILPVQPAYAEPNPETPPYIQNVYTTCANCDGKAGDFLFWESSYRNQPAELARYKSANSAMIAQGLYPVTSFNAWSDAPVSTYLPGGSNYGKPQDKGAQAYAAWVTSRTQYYAVNHEGLSPWSSEGYITPLMPLDQADWPAGTTSATYGDMMASRFSSFIVASGARGMFASDGLDELWAYDYDYNPRVIDAFVRATRLAVTGTTAPEKAAFIKSRYFKQWNDYKCGAYAKLYGDIAKKIWDGTGKSAFIGLQGAGRFYGQDPRMLEASITAGHGHFFKVVELQGDAQRELNSLGIGIVRTLEVAAQLPDSWVAAQLSAPKTLPVSTADNSLAEPTALSTIGMAPADALEFMNKYLRGHWLSVAWGHVANRDGTVRRAMQAFHAYYNGQGLVPADIERLFKSIHPVRPFGNAFYFSQAIQFNFETKFQQDWTPQISASGSGAVPVGYGISDVSLDGLVAHPENRPTGIITSDIAQIPAGELARLRAIAPVYEAKSALRIPSPIQFSGDVNGYAFIDQNGRTIVLAFRVSSRRTTMHLQGVGDVVCTISFNGVQDGSYVLTDLFNGSSTYPITISQGKGSVDVPMSRWETRAFATTIPSPNGSYQLPIDADSNVLHWKLNESGSATVASDVSGSKRTGETQIDARSALWQNNPWGPGRFGNCLTVSQSETPAHRLVSVFDYPATNFTQTFWFKTTAPIGVFYHIKTHDQNLEYPQWSNKVSEVVEINAGRVADNAQLTAGIGITPEGRNYADGAWHMVAVVRKANVGGKMYVDGALVASNPAADSIFAGNRHISFCGRDYGTGFYNGSLDDIRLYTRCLDAAEIARLYAGNENTELKPITYPVVGVSGKQGAANRSIRQPSFNGLTRSGSMQRFRLEVYEAGDVGLELYDICGKQVATTGVLHLAAGSRTVSLPKNDIASGMYVVKLRTAGSVSRHQCLIP